MEILNLHKKEPSYAGSAISIILLGKVPRLGGYFIHIFWGIFRCKLVQGLYILSKLSFMIEYLILNPKQKEYYLRYFIQIKLDD